jgi:hypothetical protein
LRLGVVLQTHSTADQEVGATGLRIGF